MDWLFYLSRQEMKSHVAWRGEEDALKDWKLADFFSSAASS